MRTRGKMAEEFDVTFGEVLDRLCRSRRLKMNSGYWRSVELNVGCITIYEVLKRTVKQASIFPQRDIKVARTAEYIIF